ncbi:integral membrane protein [Streptomyces viridochromogenes DSM 40736]|uniref:Integral membrane protein n=1 Tax=Streptomyces viridochromogenes (strain DSM 40736 / JCM 4977 / BCRC 1201 / Tue 494) TaxID=591159 RepID=D9X888_STRVT|nr:integral membrane protein [Streptomyces viridochromogenes DSM 40736]
MPRRRTSSSSSSTGSTTGTGSTPGATAPRNRTPQPVRMRRRSFGDFVKAFFAFVALAVLLVGVPGALATQIGWPLPNGVPSLDWLQQEITVHTFLNILTVVVWLAWAQFTACVLVEMKAALSGVGVPGRVPGAGPSQLLARQLVAALLLVGATAASFTPGLSQLGQSGYDANQKPTVAAAQQTPGLFAQQQEQAAGAASALAEQASHAAAHADAGGSTAKQGDTKYYRIQPPEGRHHDSLWEIADRHLGDGRRYKEIFELNKDRVQPDGSKLSEASLIRPGWIMEMPGDARGGELVEMPDEAPNVSPDVQQQISDYAQTGDHAQGGGGAQGGGHEHAGGGASQVSLPDQQRPAPDSGHQQATGVDAESDSSFGLPEALLAAPLLAAGLLGALGRRRRQALWQSAFGSVGGRRGMEPPTPTGDAQDVQDALLVGADPEGVRLLDRSLRGLAASLAEESRALPVVYAAWLSNGDLHLQLAQPAGKPPAPWQQGQDQTFWMLARADAERYEDDVDTAAPYPGLVSLGTMDDSRLLLNLEAVPGIVSLSGREADRGRRLRVRRCRVGDQRLVRPHDHHARRLRAGPHPARAEPDPAPRGHRGARRDHGGRDAAAAGRARCRRARLRPHRPYRARPAHPLGPAPRPARRAAVRRGRRQARRTRRRRRPARHRLPRRHRDRRPAGRRLGDGDHRPGQAARAAPRAGARRPVAARRPTACRGRAVRRGRPRARGRRARDDPAVPRRHQRAGPAGRLRPARRAVRDHRSRHPGRGAQRAAPRGARPAAPAPRGCAPARAVLRAVAARRHRRRTGRAPGPAARLARRRPRRHAPPRQGRHRAAHPRQVRRLRPGRAALPLPRGHAGQRGRQPGRARSVAHRRARAGAWAAARRPARGTLPVARPRDRRRPAAAARRGHRARAVRVPHGEGPGGEGHRGPQRGPAHGPVRRAAVARAAARHPRHR